MIEELENNSTNVAKKHHVTQLNEMMRMHNAQLGNITEALPVIQERVHGIDKKIQKLASTLPKGNWLCITYKILRKELQILSWFDCM